MISKVSFLCRRIPFKHTKLSLDIVQAADLLGEGALESVGIWVELDTNLSVERIYKRTVKEQQSSSLTSLN